MQSPHGNIYQSTTGERNTSIDILHLILGPLADHRAYLVYRMVPSPYGRADKIPVDPGTGEATAPNDALSRGILTFGEAADRASALGDEYGVGVVPAKVPGLVAVDLDSCVAINGEIRVDDWALALIGKRPETYAELSPSLSGLRMLLIDEDGHLLRLASGVERCGIGLYGREDCKKFVTLTGLIVEGVPEAVLQAPETVERILEHLASMMGQERVRSGGGLDFPPGPAGLEEAMQAIRDGSSLHPATARVVTAWMNDPGRSLQDIREDLLALYDQSAAKEKTPRRWRIRRDRSIDGLIAWAKDRQGRREDVRTQDRQRWQRVVQGSGSLWGGQRAAVEPEETSEGGDGEGEAPRGLWSDGEGRGAAALVTGGEGAMSLSEQYLMAFERRLAMDVEDDLAREARERPEWMLEGPSPGLRAMQEHLWSAMTLPSPEAVTAASLVLLSMATAHQGVIVGTMREATSLTLQATVAVPTGAGKEAIRQRAADIGRMVGIRVRKRAPTGQAVHQLGLNSLMERSPRGVPGLVNFALVQDEVAGFLRAAGSVEHRDGNTMSAKDAILSISAMPFGVYDGDDYADMRNNKDPLATPGFWDLGFTVPSELRGALSEQFFRDGYVNRRLLAVGTQSAPHPMGHRFPMGFEPRVTDMLEALMAGLRPESRVRGGVGFVTIRDRRFSVIDISEELEVEIETAARAASGRFDPDTAEASVFSRFAELARKVAGIMTVADAALLDLDFVGLEVTRPNVLWAIRLVRHLFDTLLADLAENRLEGRLAGPVERLDATLKQWRRDPYGHPREQTQRVGKFFEVGVYPEWALYHVVGRGRDTREVMSVFDAAGLEPVPADVARSLAGVSRGPKSGSYWGYKYIDGGGDEG